MLAVELWAADLWQAPGGPPPPVPTPPAGPITAPVSAAERSSDPVLVLLARPLFAPNRRPPRVAPAAAEAAPVASPRLTGVLVDGASRRAILVPAQGGKPVVAAEGARVEAFAVERIEPGRVTLVGPGGTRVFRPTFGPFPAAAKPVSGPVPGMSGLIGSPTPLAAEAGQR